VSASGAQVVTTVVGFPSAAGSPNVAGTPNATAAPIELVATLYEPTPPAAAGGPTISPHSLPGLIVGHGAGSARTHHDRFARTACVAGMVVLALDFRGHGDSGGTLDGPGELDIVAAAAFLRRLKTVDAERICYRGSSLGGYFGLQAALPAGFAAMALVCPATEAVMLAALDGGFDEHQARERGLQLRADVGAMRAYFRAADAHATAARIDCDVLLLHARGDTVVPLASSLELAERLCGRTDMVILSGGDHSSAQGSVAIDRLTVEWLLEHTRART
jgi:dipeptidyl aminopeptidase/acylaminoacyl peptidase